MNIRQKNSSFPLGQLHLTGSVAEQMNQFARNRIESGDAWNVVYREAEDAFRNKLDDASGVHGIWQGEFWGKWMISACRFCRYSGNGELREFIRSGVAAMLKLQEPSGYLGTYRDPMNVFPADPEKTRQLLGWDCRWNWNIWCRKYTLWGLLEAWELLEDPAILRAAERLAAHLIDSLRERNIRLGQTGTFAGIPSGSILKPMLILHRATGNGKFLAFAKEIAADWKRPDGLCPNLISNARSGKPVHEWYPNPPEWAKVYEMLSCFDGILELYRATGEAELLEAAARFRLILKQSELNPLFGVGFNDIFNHAAVEINAITEPCDVVHWMRLCGELFLETGDPSCLDDFEMAFCNPFLAAVYRDGKWGSRGVRSHGRHLTVFEQAGMTHNHCCVNNLPRGFMNMAQMAATRAGDEVSINFYTGFNADLPLEGGSLKIELDGDYLARGEVAVRLDNRCGRPLPVRFRIPGWAVSSRMAAAGRETKGDGSWFRLTLPPGKEQISLFFERRLEIRRHRVPEGDDAWFRRRWCEPGMETMFRKQPASTLVYGPLLLARSKFIGSTEEEMFGETLPPGFECAIKPVEPRNVRCEFDAAFQSGGRRFHTKVCDYASAGNEYSKDQHAFSIFF